MARALDLAVTPWGILGAGVLTGKYNLDASALGRVQQSGSLNDEGLRIGAEVVGVADEVGATPSQVAIAWLRQQPGVIVPLLGARSRDQLEDNLGALEVTLSSEQVERLDQASAVALGFPHDFSSAETVRDLLYGGTEDQLDRHR